MPFQFLFFAWALCLAVSARTQIPELLLPTGHTKQVTWMKYSPDGKKLATTGEDKLILLWDARTGRVLQRLAGHVDKVNSLDFSPDGNYLVSGGNDNATLLWDLRTGERIQTILPYTNPVTRVIFSPDGRQLLIGYNNGMALTWSIEGSAMIKQLQDKQPGQESNMSYLMSTSSVIAAGYSRSGNYIYIILNNGELSAYGNKGNLLFKEKTAVNSLFSMNRVLAGFSPDGEKLLLLQKDGYLLVNPANPAQRKKLETKGEADFINFQFSPRGDTLLAFHQFGALFQWDLNTSKCTIRELKNEMAMYYQAVFDPKTNSVLTAAGDSSIRRIDIHTASVVHRVKAGSVLQLCIDPRFDYYAVNELWHSPLIRDLRNGESTLSLSEHTVRLNNARLCLPEKQLLTASGDGKIRIWNLLTGKIEKVIKDAGNEFSKVYLSPGGHLFYSFFDNWLQVYQTGSGNLLHRLGGGPIYDLEKKKYNKYTDVTVSPDEKRIAVASVAGMIGVWNLENGKLISELKLGEWGIIKTSYTATGDYLIGEDVLGKIGIWNTRDLALTDTLQGMALERGYTQSSTANMLVYQKPDGRIAVYDIDTKKETVAYRLPEGHSFGSAVLSHDNKRLLVFGEFKTTIWDTRDKKLLLTVTQESYSVSDAAFSPDDNYFTLVTSDGVYHQYTCISGEETGSLLLGGDAVPDAGNPYGNYFIGTGPETVSLYNAETEESLQLTAIDETGSIVTTGKGWYMCTPDAARWLSWKLKENTYDFDQWDLQYNRPDKVLSIMGNTDTLLLGAYRKAWEKRLRKNGIDSLSFGESISLPGVEILNAAALEGFTSSAQVTLKIRSRDINPALGPFKLIITVNDCPIYSRSGRELGADALADTIPITLSLTQGMNVIRVSLINNRMAESLRKSVYIHYRPVQKPVSVLYFIGIGIDRFADPAHNLQYSCKDIRDLAAKLQQQYKGQVVIDTLFNEEVTTAGVKALKKRLLGTTVHDRVIISYSGHGLLSRELDYYLSSFNVNFNRPEEQGLPYEELENLLDSIPARKKLMLIDACHSGEVDKEDITRISTAAVSLQQQGTKGGEPTYTGKPVLGMKNSFELMQSLFSRVGRHSGATIISAAAGTQFALERGDLRNGVFTFSLLEVMNRYPNVKISELKKMVSERVVQLTNGLQQPTSRSEALAVDWELW